MFKDVRMKPYIKHFTKKKKTLSLFEAKKPALVT